MIKFLRLLIVKVFSKQAMVFFVVTPLVIMAIFLICTLTFNFIYRNKIYPNVFVAGINVGGLTKNEAVDLITQESEGVNNIHIYEGSQEYQIFLDNLSFKYDVHKTIDNAYSQYRAWGSSYDFLNPLKSLKIKLSLPIYSNLERDPLKQLLLITLRDVPVEPVYPKLLLNGKAVAVKNGQIGCVVDFDLLTETVYQNILFGKYDDVNIQTEKIDPTLSEIEILEYQKRGSFYIDKKISLSGPLYFKTELKTPDIISFLSPSGFYESDLDLIVNTIKSKVDKNPANSVFKEESGKVLEFRVSRNGISVKTDELKQLLKNSVENLKSEDEVSEVEIPYADVVPEITTDKVNDLGIEELLGTGYSEFQHSIISRVHNVGVASEKFNGILVAPSESFSFNKTLGDVSKYTGYQQAYIIRDGKTILGDGGGVCQVSTTLFRALLNSGLPIIERQAHSYRVSYYEQGSPPGLDATVYSPSPDLKFINDTPGYILIQTIFNSEQKNLIFEIYGTSDGRTATTTTPKIVSQISPPEDVFIEDPTLTEGKIIQVEHKAWGARVVFNYKVERNGEMLINKDFVSNYKPWGAVYMKGVLPI